LSADLYTGGLQCYGHAGRYGQCGLRRALPGLLLRLRLLFFMQVVSMVESGHVLRMPGAVVLQEKVPHALPFFLQGIRWLQQGAKAVCTGNEALHGSCWQAAAGRRTGVLVKNVL